MLEIKLNLLGAKICALSKIVKIFFRIRKITKAAFTRSFYFIMCYKMSKSTEWKQVQATGLIQILILIQITWIARSEVLMYFSMCPF